MPCLLLSVDDVIRSLTAAVQQVCAYCCRAQQAFRRELGRGYCAASNDKAIFDSNMTLHCNNFQPVQYASSSSCGGRDGDVEGSERKGRGM